MQPPSPAVNHENELYNTNSLITSPMTIVHICVHVPLILTTDSIQRRHLFQSELSIVQLLFEDGNYSRVASIQKILSIYIYISFFYKIYIMTVMKQSNFQYFFID